MVRTSCSLPAARRLGSKIARSFTPSGGWTLTPSVGLYGDWRFSSDSAIATGTQVAFIKNGWSGRVTTGRSATAKNGCSISLGGEYGGIGETFKVWTGNVRVTVPFGRKALGLANSVA